jgi:thioredoxin reductase
MNFVYTLQGNPRSKGFESLTAGFTGEIRHANTYKHVTKEHFDKKILVIGGGETASDLCNEVSYVANRYNFFENTIINCMFTL